MKCNQHGLSMFSYEMKANRGVPEYKGRKFLVTAAVYMNPNCQVNAFSYGKWVRARANDENISFFSVPSARRRTMLSQC